MKLVICAMLVGISLMGCQTTTAENKAVSATLAPNASSETDPQWGNAKGKKAAKAIGKNVGYSEICAEYQGEGAPPLILRSLKRYFRTHSDFQTGYDEFAHLAAFDFVTGLDVCDKASVYLIKIERIISKAINEKTKIPKKS